MAFSTFTGKAPTIADVQSVKAEFLIADMADNVSLTYDSNNKITACTIGAANKLYRLGYQENNQSKISFESESQVDLHTGSKKAISFKSMAEIVCLQELTLAEIQELVDHDLMLAIVNPSALNGVTGASLGSSNDIGASDVHYILDYVSIVPNISQDFGDVARYRLSFQKGDMDKLIDGVGQNIAISIT